VAQQAAHEVRLPVPVTQRSNTGFTPAVDAYPARRTLLGTDVDASTGAEQPRLKVTGLQTFLTGEQHLAADAVHRQGPHRPVQTVLRQGRLHRYTRLERLAAKTYAEIHGQGHFALPLPVVEHAADTGAQRRVTQEVQPGAKRCLRLDVEFQQ